MGTISETRTVRRAILVAPDESRSFRRIAEAEGRNIADVVRELFYADQEGSQPAETPSLMMRNAFHGTTPTRIWVYLTPTEATEWDLAAAQRGLSSSAYLASLVRTKIGGR